MEFDERELDLWGGDDVMPWSEAEPEPVPAAAYLGDGGGGGEAMGELFGQYVGGEGTLTVPEIVIEGKPDNPSPERMAKPEYKVNFSQGYEDGRSGNGPRMMCNEWDDAYWAGFYAGSGAPRAKDPNEREWRQGGPDDLENGRRQEQIQEAWRQWMRGERDTPPKEDEEFDHPHMKHPPHDNHPHLIPRTTPGPVPGR